MTRHRTPRPASRIPAVLSAALAALLAGALVVPAAWADETPPDAAIPAVDSPASEAALEPDPEPAPEAVPVVEPEPVLEPEPAEAPDPVEEPEPIGTLGVKPEPTETPEQGADKARTPVLQPGQSIQVNRTITGAAVIELAVVGPRADKHLVIVSPSGSESRAQVSSPSATHRLETGGPLADGVYRFIITNVDDEPIELSYEITWRGAGVTFAPRPPRPGAGLAVATEARINGVGFPDGTTGSVRAVAADGTELHGALERDPVDGSVWRAYLGGYTGEFLVFAELDAGPQTFTHVWTTTIESLDTTLPVVEYLTFPAASNARGWFARPVTVTLAASDAGSGVASIEWRLAGGEVQYVAGNRTEIELGHGRHRLEYRATDLAGNVTGWSLREPAIDLELPEVDAHTPAPGAVVEVGEIVTVDYECRDELSGILDCVSAHARGDALPTLLPGDYSFTVSALDRAGNQRSVTVPYRVVEAGPPTATVTIPAATGDGGWHLTAPTIDLRGDSTSVAELHWVDTVDGVEVTGSAAGTRASFMADREGIHVLRYWAVDDQGRAGEPASEEFRVDTVAPAVEVRSPVAAAPRAALGPGEVRRGAVLRADFTCADAVSGVVSCVGSTADGAPLPTDTLGWHTFTVEARDAAGHVAREAVTYRVVPAATGSGDGSGTGSGARDRLASTGGGIEAWLVPLGLALVATGGVLTVVRRPARR